jgi:hypothetical protein
MTLVVGLSSGTDLMLLSDIRISHPDATQVEELPGRLKIVVLSPTLAVAYAGAADYALDTIRGVHAAGQLDLHAAIQTLRDASARQPELVDFLVSSTRTGDGFCNWSSYPCSVCPRIQSTDKSIAGLARATAYERDEGFIPRKCGFLFNLVPFLIQLNCC